MRYILGVETSCDETSVAVIGYDINGFTVLSNCVYSQIEEHKPYGGVVPEVAARSHLTQIDKVFKKAISDAGIAIKDISKIAVTTGPGLIGSLLIGVAYATTLSKLLKIECININHLEAHALSPRLEFEIEYPYLLLLISGGHCQFVSVLSLGKYEILGTTIDDAIGEAFDKVARMLNFGYPGGVYIEQAAKHGNENAFVFPQPMINDGGCNMSFSGLKTSVLYKLREFQDKSEQLRNDVAASFQKTVATVLAKKMRNAIKLFLSKYPVKKRQIAVAGGVAANKMIAGYLQRVVKEHDFNLFVPSSQYCTDNAAMVAYVGMEYDKCGRSYNTKIKSKWSLEEI